MKSDKAIRLADGKMVIVESDIMKQIYVRMSDELIVGIVDKDEELDDNRDAMIRILRKGVDDAYHYTGDIVFDTEENYKTLWIVYLKANDENLQSGFFEGTSSISNN